MRTGVADNGPTMDTVHVDPEARAELAGLISKLSVVHGDVVLASGARATYYVDLRRATLHHAAAPLIGRLMRQFTADWAFDAVGGLTMGADPVALAMLHAEGRPLDAFVVRKQAKAHGMQRRIEGPDVTGRRVLVVEDTSTTGGSPLTAVGALRDTGATVVGVATVVDRETGAAQAIAHAGLEYRALFGLADLGLA
jgi:orotate phosphoribosyltransferase